MTTVRDATFELFRAHGMTTMFGNPGSTELPMLADFPDDFTYVLGLQELVVIGMADGYAQATGRPTHVNLHTAPGVGNAVGGIFNAQANKSPLVITAGQQVRAQITIEANLTNRDADGRAAAVREMEPRAAARRRTCPARSRERSITPSLPPRGPAFVSIPMDDWSAEADADRSAAAIGRRVSVAAPLIGRRSPSLPGAWRRRCRRSGRRAPTSTPPEGGTPPSPLPRSSGCPCGPARRPAARGWASPSAIPTSSVCCPPRSGRCLRP